MKKIECSGFLTGDFLQISEGTYSFLLELGIGFGGNYEIKH